MRFINYDLMSTLDETQCQNFLQTKPPYYKDTQSIVYLALIIKNCLLNDVKSNKTWGFSKNCVNSWTTDECAFERVVPMSLEWVFLIVHPSCINNITVIVL